MMEFDIGDVQNVGLIQLGLVKNCGLIDGEQAWALTDIGKKMMLCVWYYNQLSHDQKEILSVLYAVLEPLKKEPAEKAKTDIICPKCGWKQTVDTEMWLFQSTQGHGYTCGSGKCPSHTYMVLDLPPAMPENLRERLTRSIDKDHPSEWEKGYLAFIERIFKDENCDNTPANKTPDKI